MLLKILPVALVAATALVSIAEAQGRPPANLPPAGFAGQQWVDSRGCLYIRAGHGGQVNWVARIDNARKPICGQTPTAQTMAASRAALATEAAEPAPAAAPAARPGPVAAAPRPAAPRAAAPRGAVAQADYMPPPVSYGAPTPLARGAAPAPALTGAPGPTVFSSAPSAPAPVPSAASAYRPAAGAHVAAAPSPAPAPTVFGGSSPAPAAPRQAAAYHPQPAISASRVTGCPDFAPHGQIYHLRRGGTTLLCASAPHRIANLSPAQAEAHATRAQAAKGTHAPAMANLDAPPPGYKPAWRDDRLNPNRARGTAQGQAQMAQVWTNEVPQQLQPGQPGHTPRKATVSSKGQAPKATVAGARFVQVGSFGVPANADRAASKLRAMGLPVQVSRSQIKGKPVQVVRAGPFASADQAGAALSAARRAGFGDAILRR